MKSPALEVRNPSREVPQHRTMCIPLERELAVGMVASPAWGKVKCQGEPATKPAPEVQFGMNHTAHFSFQLVFCVSINRGSNKSNVQKKHSRKNFFCTNCNDCTQLQITLESA